MAAQRFMEVDVEALCGAGYSERGVPRLSARNGYRERPWQRAPERSSCVFLQTRKGGYFPPFLEPWRAVRKALTAVLQEA